MEESCSKDWHLTKNILDFNKDLKLEISSQDTQREVSQRGSSRNKLISCFRYCSSFIFLLTLFKSSSYTVDNAELQTLKLDKKTCIQLNLKEDFNNFKNLMINEFKSIKCSFFKEVNSFKRQLLETSKIDPTRIQSQADNINISSILKGLIVQLQDQVSTLNNHLDRKDKVLNTTLEKLEKKHHEEISLSQATTNSSSVVQTFSVVQATSVKTQHDNINRNQDSSINSITKAQKITQAITNTDVPPISKENAKNKPVIKNESNTICRKSTEQDQPDENPKSKRNSIIILGDSLIKHTNGWEIAKKKPKQECKVFFIRNFAGATTQCMADYIKPLIQAK